MKEKIDEFIDALKKLKNSVAEIESVNEEIKMWRGRFLTSLRHENEKVNKVFIFYAFYYMTSMELMKKSPEKHIQDIKRDMNENQQIRNS